MEVSFYQKGYMDSPTPAAEDSRAEARGRAGEVELSALFNDQVFTVEGVTPLTGEVIVTYKMQGGAGGAAPVGRASICTTSGPSSGTTIGR